MCACRNSSTLRWWACPKFPCASLQSSFALPTHTSLPQATANLLLLYIGLHFPELIGSYSMNLFFGGEGYRTLLSAWLFWVFFFFMLPRGIHFFLPLGNNHYEGAYQILNCLLMTFELAPGFCSLQINLLWMHLCMKTFSYLSGYKYLGRKCLDSFR